MNVSVKKSWQRSAFGFHDCASQTSLGSPRSGVRSSACGMTLAGALLLGLAFLPSATAEGWPGEPSRSTGRSLDFRLSPSVGRPTTVFVVGFRAPYTVPSRRGLYYEVEPLREPRCNRGRFPSW